MAGGIYGTRVTVIGEAEEGTLINDGLPCFIHNVHIACAATGLAAIFTQTTEAAGDPAVVVGAMTATTITLGGPDVDWSPEAIFDKGFRLNATPVVPAACYITVVWRPCG
jgi:hypothetical protein